METFAHRLKKAREFEGWTQKQMAEKLDIPFTTYRSYETLSGANREPDFAMTGKIADLLKVTTDYLILGRE